MIFLTILIAYGALMIAIGVIASRSVRASGDFFVAGRNLGPGLLFSTLLAANIGAGSTVGAAGLGYRDGLSAWWWVGSAGIGSMILAFTVGPRIWQIARDRGLYTVGDYLEFRYDRRVRGIIAALLWMGSLTILAGQLIAIAWILNVAAGISKGMGCAIGAGVATAYFAFGGLPGAARVNALQLIIKFAGFGTAFVFLLRMTGEFFGRAIPDPQVYFNFFGDGVTPLKYLVLLAPSFLVSPGLLQKIFGARDAQSVRLGVALNALCLLAFACIPAFFGIIAHDRFPDLDNRELALPTLLTQTLPVWLGGLLLGAIFAAEVSTADAVLFMLSTSLSKDLYKTFIKPAADDRTLVKVARATAISCGVLGAVLAMLLPNVISALTIFYTLLAAGLTLPLLAGLYTRAVTPRAAITAIIVSIAATLGVELATSGAGFGIWPPLVLGLGAGLIAMIATTATDRQFKRG
ncbi:MAG: sodium:solute symporter family protein [Blastocatellales bacterium]|nr:sodium:solute symporter family protein [Blastocatellales bacterium]